MYKKIKITPNVRGLQIYQQQLFTTNTQDTLFCNGELLQEHIDLTSSLEREDWALFLSSNERATYSFQKGSIHKISMPALLKTLESNQVVVYEYSLPTSLFKLALYDLEQQRIIKQFSDWIPLGDGLCQGNTLFYFDQTRVRVIALSLETGQKKWSTQAVEGYYRHPSEQLRVEIIQFIGIYENQLIGTTNSDEFFSLDTETGELLWQTKDFVKTHFSDARNAVELYGLELRDGKLYHLIGNSYYSFDLKTQQVNLLWEDLKETDYLKVTHRFYTEDFIYFTAAKNSALEPIWVGVFNRKTLQVDWLEKVKGQKWGLNRGIHAAGDKLYVLDGNETLHIYQRDLTPKRRTRRIAS